MTVKLFLNALIKYLCGVALVGALLFWSMPLVLGSWLSFLLFLPFPLVLAVRIRHEERLLEQELEGYREYRQKVKYRLIPFLW